MAVRKLEVVIVGNASQLQATFGKAATGAEAFGKKMAAVGSGLTRHISLPIVGIGAVATKMSLDFHQSMEQVRTQAGASQKEVDAMSKSVLGLAKDVPQGPKALAHALYDLESVGLRGKTALAGLRAAAKGAAIGNADLGETTSALASTMVAYHLRAGDAGRTMGQLNAIVGVGKMRMDDLNAALASGVLPTAKAVGLKIKDVGGALATLTDAGVPAAQAATKLRTAFFLMAAPTTKAKKALKEVGLGAEDVAKAMRSGGIVGGLELLRKHLDGLSKVKKVQVLSEAFGGSRSAATLVTLIDNLGRVKTKVEGIAAGAKKFPKDWAATQNTEANKLKTAWSALQVSLIKIGDILAPIVEKAAGIIGKMADAFNHLPGPVKKTMVEVLAAAAVLGPLVLVGGKTIAMLSKLGGAFRLLGPAAKLGMAGLGTPLGSAMGALMMGAFIGTMLNKIPAVRHAADSIANTVGGLFGSASNEAQKFDQVMAKITGNVDMLANAFKHAESPARKTQIALSLQATAAKAAAAQWEKQIQDLRFAGATMDGTNAKSQKLRAAVDGYKGAVARAQAATDALRTALDHLPSSKTIDISINTHSTGGGAFGQNLPAPGKPGSRRKGKAAKFVRHPLINHGDYSFKPEHDLITFQGERDSLQASFDAADQAARRSRDIHDEHLGGKKNAGTRKSAIADLKALNAEIKRAKALGAIDLKIKGQQQAIDFKNAIADIRKQLHDASRAAADAFRTLREGQISAVHDQAIKDIGNSADAQELARLQGDDAAKQSASTKAQLDHDLAVAQAGYTREQAALDEAAVQKQRDDAAKLLADSIAANDLKGIEKAKALQKDADAQEAAIKQGGQAVIDAQNAIDAFNNQKREDELAANIAAATQKADDSQTTALSGLDQEVADYQSALDTKLQAEADQLANRKENYATFLADLANIAKGYGLSVSDLIASTPDQETAIDTPIATGGTVQPEGKPHHKHKHKAAGGPVRAGEAYIVGEKGEELFVPGQDGRIIPNGARTRSRGGVVANFYNNKFGSTVDLDRALNKVAFRASLA